MSLDPGELIIGGQHRIHVAPLGTALPTHLSGALNAAFVDLGYTTEDGAKFTDSKNIGSVGASQSFYSVRDFVHGRDAAIEFTLLQWNRDTFELAFGGGSWTEPVDDEFRYTPPSPEDIDQRAVVLDVTDGDRNFRIVAERSFVVSNVNSTFAKSGPGLLPITLKIEAPDASAAPWTFDTNDPAFEGTGS